MGTGHRQLRGFVQVLCVWMTNTGLAVRWVGGEKRRVGGGNREARARERETLSESG